jgi:hypothetical protein
LDRALLQASAKRGCETLPRPTTWGRAITSPSPSKPCPDLRCSTLLLDTHPVMAPSPWTNTIVLLIVVLAYLIFSRDSGSNPEVLAPPARLSLHSTPSSLPQSGRQPEARQKVCGRRWGSPISFFCLEGGQHVLLFIHSLL